MKRADVKRLAHLRELAALKRDAELAKLAVVAQSRARLLAALDGLDGVEAPLDGDSTPGLIRARLAYAAWMEGRRRVLNERLALVNADYLARRPAALQAFGRAEVLGGLLVRHSRKSGNAV